MHMEDLKNEKGAYGEKGGQPNPFSAKVTEYFERIKKGEQKIEDILNGIQEDGAIFNSIKQEAYSMVPHSCRDNTNKPYDFPVLEDFLVNQTLSTNEEENMRNKRLRKAILYFSKLDWEKEEQKMAVRTEEEQYIQELKKQLDIEVSDPEKEIVNERPSESTKEDFDNFQNEKTVLEKNIQLPERIREHEQEPIGDLNGSYESFVAHLTNRDLATFENGEMTWTGQDKKVVFVGDILGDRTPQGLRIYADLLKLKNLAQKAGGDVTWLSGNHENMFNAVLCGFPTEFGSSVEVDMQKRLNQYSGNLELVEFLPDSVKDQITSEVKAKKEVILNELNETIQAKERVLRHMKSNNFGQKEISIREELLLELKNNKDLIENIETTPIEVGQVLSMSEYMPKSIQNTMGKAILENRSSIKETMRTQQPEMIEAMREQQLIEMYDDTLYVHTNLTKEMVEIIKKNINEGQTVADSIKKINTFYQNCLNAYIDDNEKSLNQSQIDSFNKIRDVFISTSSESRVNFSENPNLTSEEKERIETELKSLGINLVVHGHNDEDGTPKGSSTLPILSIDRSAYKSDNPRSFSPISAGSISKTGQVSYF